MRWTTAAAADSLFVSMGGRAVSPVTISVGFLHLVSGPAAVFDQRARLGRSKAFQGTGMSRVPLVDESVRREFSIEVNPVAQ
jgi:hypothetical protein